MIHPTLIKLHPNECSQEFHVSIKNYICYFFNNIINIKSFDPNNIKID